MNLIINSNFVSVAVSLFLSVYLKPTLGGDADEWEQKLTAGGRSGDSVSIVSILHYSLLIGQLTPILASDWPDGSV